MSSVFKAIADPTRRSILEMLREQEMSAGEIADRLTISKPTLSGHLAILKEAGLVDVTRAGTTLIHRLNLSVLEDALVALMSRMSIDLSKGRAAASEETPS